MEPSPSRVASNSTASTSGCDASVLSPTSSKDSARRGVLAQLRRLPADAKQQRLEDLQGLLELKDLAAAQELADNVPGLLLRDPADLSQQLRDVFSILHCSPEDARGACTAEPLLLVLPPSRIAEAVSTVASVMCQSRKAARGIVRRSPQLATLAPATLTAKLTGLTRVLGGGAAVAAAAVRASPILLTFSTPVLQQHHAALGALLGPDRLARILCEEPAVLGLSPDTLATKLRVLAQLLDCGQAPGRIAALAERRPDILKRSLSSLSHCCRALSIWKPEPGERLAWVEARPGLLLMSWKEVHGRCRWLRRLVLSNGYYHSALRRVPPSVVAGILWQLPGAWARLQFLADSGQERAIPLMDVVECGQEDFEERFPECRRWHEWKLKEMGTDSPWKDAYRIRGIGTPHDPKQGTRGGTNQHNKRLLRQGQAAEAAGAVSGPTIPVVLQEAGMVTTRSGSTVCRPRRVVQQTLQPSPPADEQGGAGLGGESQGQQPDAWTEAPAPAAQLGPAEPAAAVAMPPALQAASQAAAAAAAVGVARAVAAGAGGTSGSRQGPRQGSEQGPQPQQQQHSPNGVTPAQMEAACLTGSDGGGPPPEAAAAAALPRQQRHPHQQSQHSRRQQAGLPDRASSGDGAEGAAPAVARPASRTKRGRQRRSTGG